MRARAWSERMSAIIINPNCTAAMTDAMLGVAKRAAPALHWEGWTSFGGPPAIQRREDGEAASPPLLVRVREAAERRAAGIVIGCFDDTALEPAALSVPVPLIGIGQAAYHLCALRGWQFSVVTTLSVSVPVIEENIHRYGLAGLLGRVRASEVPVLALEDDPDGVIDRIAAEAGAAIAEDGIDAIVLGCAGMVRVVNGLRARLPVPVIDPVEAAAGCLEWLVRADRA
ncbi:aspartate/glutamate racemase family protein [Mesobacterium sp. TK19101]|uniref:Aspartate/glutamate racemase family protein n=1 Tax=Mesobacterium hydrothermale TaxID=3111907 RepID=A0ABU6HH63_9RHOB|nr:aspartate/glutamate racemase family protein [Mesobacterium sp. TK19101]MEC3861757.1 aspartate/glutamate racemase family protein [Mesobacterium sp. TK19101]